MGTVTYYNTKLDKAFDDESSDLIEENDIDGVEMSYADQQPRRARRVDYSAMAIGNYV